MIPFALTIFLWTLKHSGVFSHFRESAIISLCLSGIMDGMQCKPTKFTEIFKLVHVDRCYLSYWFLHTNTLVRKKKEQRNTIKSVTVLYCTIFKYLGILLAVGILGLPLDTTSQFHHHHTIVSLRRRYGAHAYFIVVACRTTPSDSAQTAEGLACERRWTSGRCAEGNGQAGGWLHEPGGGEWRACKQMAITGCGKNFT